MGYKVMEWKDVAKIIGSAAPLVGSLVGGPAGTAIGAVVASALGVAATPGAISKALIDDPDAAAKVQQIEATRQAELQALVVAAEANRLTADTAAIQSVNATMQTEAQADHWPTYSWRPAIGFAVAFNTTAAALLVVVVYIAVVFGAPSATTAMTSLPMVLGALAAISATVMPILGIASYFRGKAQADPAIPTDNRG